MRHNHLLEAFDWEQKTWLAGAHAQAIRYTAHHGRLSSRARKARKILEGLEKSGPMQECRMQARLLQCGCHGQRLRCTQTLDSVLVCMRVCLRACYRCKSNLTEGGAWWMFVQRGPVSVGGVCGREKVCVGRECVCIDRRRRCLGSRTRVWR